MESGAESADNLLRYFCWREAFSKGRVSRRETTALNHTFGRERAMPVNKQDSTRHEDDKTMDEGDTLENGPTPRLDGLLPSDKQTGAVTMDALKIYVQAMMEMVTRCYQPLSMLYIAVDECAGLDRFRREDMGMVARAIMRCMQQETRNYDVIGRTDETDAYGLPSFLIVCPLMTETQAAQLAERLRATMTAYAVEAEQEWLTLSIGVSSLAIDVHTTDELMARTLSSLKRAQRQGGNQIARHTDFLRSIQEGNESRGDES
jgi:diguanylate cyclase (GGDEF)-like protein